MARKANLTLVTDNDEPEGFVNVNGFHDADDAVEYVQAGHATITLESRRTGKHFTYKVNRAKDRDTGRDSNRWFVAVLNGPDNESDYAYIGLLEVSMNGCRFRQTAKARFKADAPCVKGLEYFWKHVERGHLPTDMIVRHNGHCGRCGRTLTVPASIERGIGPECANKMGI
jgi:hypothetical protein